MVFLDISKIQHKFTPPLCCDACNSTNVVHTRNDVIYGKLYGEWPYIYYCNDCGASVGCHCGTAFPLGRMAGKETKELRKRAHKAFDPIWRTGLLSRSAAYIWIASMLQVELEFAHISVLSDEQLKLVEQIATEYYEENKDRIERTLAKRKNKRAKQYDKNRSYIAKRKNRK